MRILAGAIIALVVLYAHPTQAMYIVNETERVPIDRVLSNLTARLAANSNDVSILSHLARIHSMAYATNLMTVEVIKKNGAPVFEYPGLDDGVPDQVVAPLTVERRRAANQHLTNAIWYYARAISLVFKGTNQTAHRWEVKPLHLGYAWCLDQAKRTNEAIVAYRKALQLAWKQEVDQDFSIKEQIGWSWDRLRARQNPFSQPPKALPDVCFSGEIIKYLLALLDPAKDGKEIAQLRKDQAKLQSMGRWITPIIVSLENAGFDELTDPDASVSFDLDGSGLGRRWSWITPEAAWLVYDHDGSGRITSGLQMFGNVTFWIFWHDGYEALSSLDDNGDGQLTDSELRCLALWRDTNSDGISDPHEVRSVVDYDVVAIRCGGQLHESGILFNPHGVVLKDQSTRATFDWIGESK